LSDEASYLPLEEITEMSKRFSYDEIPPEDYLIMDKWFDLDSLSDYFSYIIN